MSKSPNTDPGHRTPPVQGFTLFETILALGVTFLIVTTAFGVVTSCMELGDAVRTSRTAREEAAAVEDLFRNFFSALPENAILECRVSGSSRAQLSEIRVQNAPSLAGTVLNPGPNEVLVIHTTEELGGYLRLSVGVSEGRIGSARTSGISGFAVAGQIAVCQWRFFQLQRNEWLESWQANMGRPRFVELTFAQTSAAPERWVFPVPVFAAAPASGAIPSNPDQDGDGSGDGGGGGRDPGGNPDNPNGPRRPVDPNNPAGRRPIPTPNR